MKKGLENWIVDCMCGDKDDDDREKMFACDTCGVWQYTRCCGILTILIKFLKKIVHEMCHPH